MMHPTVYPSTAWHYFGTVTYPSTKMPYYGASRTLISKNSLPYLPATIKLDQSVENEKAILGFSWQAAQVFRTLYPKSESIEKLQKSPQSELSKKSGILTKALAWAFKFYCC